MKTAFTMLLDDGKKVVFLSLSILFMVFSASVYRFAQRQDQPELNPLADEGRMLWSEHNCSGCHQLYGLGGYLGPDLTNFMSRKEKGEVYAGVLLKSGIGIMPAFHLGDREISAIVEYLRVTDSTGIFPGDGSPGNADKTLSDSGNR